MPQTSPARPSVRAQLAALVEESADVDQLAHELIAFLSELAAREPEHPLLSGIVAQMGRQSAEALAAAMMHDVGNLLQVVLAHLEVMRGDLEVVFDPSRSDARARIERLLSFREAVSAAREATAAAGELSTRGARVYSDRERDADIGEVVDTAFDLGRRLVRVGARVSVDNRASGLVRASRPDLLRVLINLLRNAGDAVAGFRGGNILIEAWQTPETAFVSVSDDGPGIPSGELERIFELFHTTKGQGAGVGLYACRTLVRGWSGELQVQSSPGEGARFTLSVPRVSDE